MILIKLYDPGVATSTAIGSENPLYICDIDSRRVTGDGYELDGQFYYPALLKQIRVSWSGKNWLKMSGVSIEVDREFAKRFTSEEIEVTMWLWSENDNDSKFMVFDGVGVKGKFDSISYEYRLTEQDYDLGEDLLSLAPDFKQVDSETTTYDDERTYPMYFGYVKHIVPLALAATCAAGCGGTYDSGGGEATALYDGGQDVNYSQSGDTITKTGPKAVYQVTADIDASSGAAGSVTGEPILGISNRTFETTWADRPTTSTHILYVGDTLTVTDQNNETYRWSGSAWVENTVYYDGLQGTKPPSDANNTADAMDAGVTVTGTDGGLKAAKSSYSDTTTGWFIGRDGGTAKMNVGGSNYFIKWDGTNPIIKGQNFEMDAAGDATFSGDLSAAGGTFSGDLSAAGGTFAGTLSAAGGRFLGDVSFLNDSGTYYSKRILLKSFPDGNSLPFGGLISYPTSFSPYNSTGSTDNRFASATNNLIALTTTGKKITVGNKEYQLAFTIVKTGSANPIDYYIQIIGYQTLNRTTTGLYSFTSGVEFYINFLTTQSIEVYVPSAWYVDFSGNQQISFYMYDNNSAGTFTTTEYGINFMAVNE